MMNNKRYTNPMQQQQQYNSRPYPPQPQGAAGSARNPNGPIHRVQNGPRQAPPPQQQQQQQQVQHQPQHGMGGVPSSQHSHAHATSAPQQQQGQPQQHPQQMAFAGYPTGQQFFIPTGVPYTQIPTHGGHPYYQINQTPVGVPQQIYRQAQAPNFQIIYPGPNGTWQATSATHPTQQLLQQQHNPQAAAAAAQQAHAAQQWYQHHLIHAQHQPQHPRLPVHPNAVHAPVQGQINSVHQSPGGHVQQQQQQASQQHSHPNIPHVPQQQQQQQQQPTAANSTQMVNRTTEGGGGQTPIVGLTERKRKILNIVDPNTGARVIGDSTDANNENPPSSSPSTTESNQPNSGSTTEGNGDVVIVVVPSETSSQESSSQSAPEVSAQGPTLVEETIKTTSEKVVVVVKPAVEEPVDEPSKSKARAEFFQKITQASDDGGRTASTTSATNTTTPGGGSVDPPSPTPAAQAPEQPDSPPIDSAKSQQTVVTTPAANTSSDDSKDTSLVSVSPIPIEAYLTPRKTSPPGGQTEDRSFEEENLDSHEDESLSTTVETKDDDVVSPSQQEQEEEIDDDVQEEEPSQKQQLTESETSTVEIESICPIIINKDNDIDEDDVEDEEALSSVNDKSESPTNEPPSEEQASVAHQNGELEEGELAPDADENDDDEGIETEGAEETGTTESAAANNNNSSIDQSKGKIKKYDRDFLLNVGKQIQQQTKPNIPGGILPDVARDANSMRPSSQHMSKSPGGPNRGGDQFGSMGRRGPNNQGGPNKGPGGGLGGMMGMNYPNRGMMGWAPMMVPPRPPPPKVIELTREEVKLHKAENAWKPGSIKHKDRGSEGKDPEEAITDDIVKKTRGILNKLTPENFTNLVQKFISLPLEDKEERISKVIKVVFEKAVDEPSFSKEYAKMVYEVCSQSAETSRKFRKQILDQCQQEFQNNSQDETKIKEKEIELEQAEEDKKEQLKAELEDLKFQSRRRSLGNIRFIGELYKLQMLTPKIMVECVGMLLASSDEENLEGLCKLLTTVGAKLEEQLMEIVNRVNLVRNQMSKMKQSPDDPNGPKLPKFIPDDNWMTKTFNSLRHLSENKGLSSRIRFALLDVVELRDNNWKPRRDANAPKTIDEVRRDAIRQEQEEKRQISNLPPPSLDQRGSSRAGPTQPKKGDWNVQNKSSRFAVKSKDTPATLPLLAPPPWGRSGGSSMPSNKPPVVIAPRFANRFNTLAEDRDRDNRDRLNSNQQQQSPLNSRDSMPPSHHQQQQHHHPQPPYTSTPPYASPRRMSPAPSSTSSRESSRPVSPKETNSGMNNESTLNVNETVKNIFEEYCSCGNTADSLDWIKLRFPGDKVEEFLDELSRQVGEMSKLTQQQKAGSLVRTLIKSNEISLSKETVLSTLSRGVIADLPDIIIDVPMVSSYLAQFLVEIFHDDRNLDWLLALDEVLKDSEDYDSAWNDLCTQSLTVLRSKTNEDVVRTMYTSTKDKSRIPLQDLSWVSPDPESIAQVMIPVLKNLVVNKTDENEIRQALKENSWDPREEIISHSLIEAICIISWTLETRQWDETILKKLLPILPVNPNLFPKLWKRVCDFIVKNDVDAAQKDALWDLLYIFNLATSEDQEQPSD